MRKATKKRRSKFLIALMIFFAVILAFVSAFYGIFFNEINALVSIRKHNNFYIMSYRYNYYFDDFLEVGAANDNELKEFIMGKLLHGLPFDFAIPEYGCSTFTAENSAGERLFARNYDWEDSPMMMVRTKPKNGYKSISFVDLSNVGYSFDNLPDSIKNKFLCLAAPYIPLDGMNEKGVAIAVNSLTGNQTQQQTNKTPITTTTLVRLVLDKAASVDEAIDLIYNYDYNDSAGGRFHFQIADSSGKSVVIEYEENQMIAIRGEGKYQAMTNFTLNNIASPKGFGWDRYDILKEVLDAKEGVMAEKEAMQLLQQVKMDWENEDRTTGGSVWSIVYNLKTKRIKVVYLQNYDKVYNFRL